MSPVVGFRDYLSMLGQLKQNSIDWVAYKPWEFVSFHSRLWKSKLKMLADVVGVSSCFLGGCLCDVSSFGGSRAGAPQTLVSKNSNSSPGDSNLMTQSPFQCPDSMYCHIGDLVLAYQFSWGHKHPDYGNSLKENIHHLLDGEACRRTGCAVMM